MISSVDKIIAQQKRVMFDKENAPPEEDSHTSQSDDEIKRRKNARLRKKKLKPFGIVSLAQEDKEFDYYDTLTAPSLNCSFVKEEQDSNHASNCNFPYAIEKPKVDIGKPEDFAPRSRSSSISSSDIGSPELFKFEYGAFDSSAGSSSELPTESYLELPAESYLQLPPVKTEAESVFQKFADWSDLLFPPDFKLRRGHLSKMYEPVKADMVLIEKQAATCTCQVPDEVEEKNKCGKHCEGENNVVGKTEDKGEEEVQGKKQNKEVNVLAVDEAEEQIISGDISPAMDELKDGHKESGKGEDKYMVEKGNQNMDKNQGYRLEYVINDSDEL